MQSIENQNKDLEKLAFLQHYKSVLYYFPFVLLFKNQSFTANLIIYIILFIMKYLAFTGRPRYGGHHTLTYTQMPLHTK